MKSTKGWLSSFAGSALVPLLVTYFFIGTCGGGKRGLVVAFRSGKIAVTAAWCEAEPAERSSEPAPHST
jgi:hypothetical protein